MENSEERQKKKNKRDDGVRRRETKGRNCEGRHSRRRHVHGEKSTKENSAKEKWGRTALAQDGRREKMGMKEELKNTFPLALTHHLHSIIITLLVLFDISRISESYPEEHNPLKYT